MIDVLTDLFIKHGVPTYIRSDNGPEFVAEAVRNWISTVGVQTAYIGEAVKQSIQWIDCRPNGSPWENGYIESFNARFRD